MSNVLFRKMSGVEDVLGSEMFFKELKENIIRMIVNELEIFRKCKYLDIPLKEAKMSSLYKLYELFESVEDPHTLNRHLSFYGALSHLLGNIDWTWRRYWYKVNKLLMQLNFDDRKHKSLLSMDLSRL